ncbi:MAG: DUF1292 domain-containing protein [Lachnospiraceae bacterium]|nr:DUF1292 domain-containing protein [Lachnospiraceae bacterium]
MKNDNIITLTDELGNDISFEFLDRIEYEGDEYIVLCCLDTMDEDGGEVTILRVQDGVDEEDYTGVEDEAVLDAVFDIFMKNIGEA